MYKISSNILPETMTKLYSKNKNHHTHVTIPEVRISYSTDGLLLQCRSAANK